MRSPTCTTTSRLRTPAACSATTQGSPPAVRAAVQREGAATFAPRLLGEAVGDPELHAIFYANLIKPRRDQMRLVLERAVARGEIRDDLDLDLMIDLFAGPAVYRLLITGGDMSKMFAVEEQIDALLNGLRPARISANVTSPRARACSTKRSSIATRCPRPITCGCMATRARRRRRARACSRARPARSRAPCSAPRGRRARGRS